MSSENTLAQRVYEAYQITRRLDGAAILTPTLTYRQLPKGEKAFWEAFTQRLKPAFAATEPSVN